MDNDALMPCRAWLGLDPAELELPHRLLGIAAGETDPLTIVRAADRRIAIVRTAPRERAAERDALVAQIEAARDTMLAAAGAGANAAGTHGGVASKRPLVPPPVPPITSAPDTTSEEPFPVIRRRVIHKQRSDGRAAAIALSAVILAVAAMILALAWPSLNPAAKRASNHGSKLKKDSATLEPRPKPAPKPQPDVKPEAKPTPAPKPDLTPEPTPPPTPPQPEPDPAPGDVEEVRSAVGVAIQKAFASLRGKAFSDAERHLNSVAEVALDDQQATDRWQRWRLLVSYAEKFPAYRDRALASAAATAATYDIESRQVGVVELNDRQFIYRDSRRPGRNIAVPRDEIPADVERVLVEAWFAADGRAANHLFLGAAALACPEPDLDRARREWETASAAGEADGQQLLELLADPAVRVR